MKKSLLLFTLVILQLVSRSQQSAPVITNLVFEGAGIRGIAYCGAIQELESKNILAGVQRFGGTSAGAIVALTLSLGYTSKEIEETIGATNFKKFNDGRYLFVGGIARTNKYFGWYKGNRFENWLEKIIEKKTGKADITFEELSQKGFKDLFITGTCLNRQQLVVFSKYSYPRMKIKDAVRISISIPFYFEAVFIDSAGAVVNHPKNKSGLDVMVDGGIIGNFPMNIFTENEYGGTTIGFRIDSDEQIKSDRQNKSLAAMPTTNFKEYTSAFYNIIIENLNRSQLNEEDWRRTISISDGGIGPRIRKLSNAEIELLINNGRTATKTYLN